MSALEGKLQLAADGVVSGPPKKPPKSVNPGFFICISTMSCQSYCSPHIYYACLKLRENCIYY